MDSQIRAKLLEINQSFYECYSGSFSATRHQVQPGVGRLMQNIPLNARIVDIGCGNGTLARALASQDVSGNYLGVDLSAGLLEQAQQLLNDPPAGSYAFQLIDLADPHWPDSVPQHANHWLVSFAVLHHLPGDDLRLQTVRAFQELLAPGGQVGVSVWQWHNSPRLRKRVLPWSTIGLDPVDLDKGDVLLDWRADKVPGLRYVHTFTEEHLTALATQVGFKIKNTFYADGKSGDLALYQVWQVS